MNEQTNSLMEKILDKYKNVHAVTFTTYNNDLVINFSGFESQEDLKDFADFVFSKIRMQYVDLHKMPSIH
jgi:hypothetical protein